MVLRVLPWTENAATHHRLEKILSPLDIHTVNPTATNGLWETVQRSRVDVVVQYFASNDPEHDWQPLADRLGRLAHRPTMLVLKDEPVADSTSGAGCHVGTNWTCIRDDARCQASVKRVFDELYQHRAARPVSDTTAWPLRSLATRLAERPATDRMRNFVHTAVRVANADTTLLFLGETGVGKEWFARALNAESERRDAPFVAVNCAGVSETLLDSELFGYEPGAYTGATQNRRGAFELADGGTIFLDEIGEMPLHLQCKLLRVLQDRSVRRLGSEIMRPVNVRVMTATNRDLRAEVRERRFREDLYYRVGVVTLAVPPLREHRADVPDLLMEYLVSLCARLGRDVHGFTESAWERLRCYSWPGNVRQLINTVERAILMCDDGWINCRHLPAEICEPFDEAEEVVAGKLAGTPVPGAPLRSMRAARAEFVAKWERNYLEQCLTETRGRIQDAADLAGINPRSLRDMMRRHGLAKEQFRRLPKPRPK